MSKQTFWKDVVFPSDIVDLRSVGPEGLIVPQGTTALRPSTPIVGTFRYNTTNNETELYQSGSWSPIQTAITSGEPNTASNLGAGQGVFESKAGFDLRFKSLVAGTNVTIGSNATTITINAPGVGEINTASNVGAGTGTIFESKAATDLQLRSLTSLSGNLTIVNNGNEIDFDLVGLVAGETNDGVNVGGGSLIYKDKVGLDLRFRSLTGDGNEIVLLQTANEISIGIVDNPIIPGLESMTIPFGPAGSEPTPVNGMLRYDTTTDLLRAVIDGTWETLVTSLGTFLALSGGTMTGNITLSSGADIIGGAGSELQLQSDIVMIAGADIDMSSGGDILMQAAALVDGRDISADGATLDAINTTASFGIVARTGDPNTFVRRTVTGVANQIVLTNGDGVSGNPSIGIADNPVLPGTEAVRVPLGTTAERAGAPAEGSLRVNTDDDTIEYFIGGNWLRPVTTNGGVVTGGDIDMGGNDITNINLTDGRDLTVDGVTIDEIVAIVDETGVLVKSGGVIVTRLIQANAANNRLGIDVLNGDGGSIIEIGVDVVGLGSTVGLNVLDALVVYDDDLGTNVKATIGDITALLTSTGLDAELDVTGEFGFLTRVADGSPGSFERRTIIPATADPLVGIDIVDGDGILGDPVIGLDIHGTGETTVVGDSTEVIVWGATSNINVRATLGTLRDNYFNGNFRASATGVAVSTGITVIPVTLGTGDFDQNTKFNDGADSFTPASGTYRMGAYLEVDATTIAGTYTLRIRRNGTPEGNRAVIVADSTNVDSVMLDDMFQANGTDVFTVEINNASGMASTLAVVRFFGHRVY